VNSYRGESPAKKLVRLEFWRGARELLPNFSEGNKLVLSSAEGGDTSVLLGMGMRPSLIHAVDIDKHAADAATWKLGVEVQNCDVFKHAENFMFDAVLLDFCGPLRESMLPKLCGLLSRISHRGVLGLSLLAGRENGSLKEAVASLLQRTDGDSFLTRAKLITSKLYGMEKRIRLKSAWYYHSHRRRSYGQPMIVLLFQLTTSEQPTPNKQVAAANLWIYEADASGLAAEGMKLMRKGERADLLLNVSRQTLAAWKAHATRGTYSK
jgi:hypothetical protein